MAHELFATDYMVSNKLPWHGLGAVVPGNISAAKALSEARLNWEVSKEPVFDGKKNEIKNHRLVRRSDTKGVLGIVSDKWEPVQNSTLLEIAEALAQVNDCEFKPVIETAGSLREGRIVWCLVKTGERKFADSQHREYLLLSNGHDGTRRLRGTLTDVRVVCANTLSLAESERASLLVRHTKNVHTRLSDAINILGWANSSTNATFKIYETLRKTTFSTEDAKRFFLHVIEADIEKPSEADEEKCDNLLSLFNSGQGCEGRSAFDALNAVTDYVDHKQYKGIEENRFFSSFFGYGSRLKSRAFASIKEISRAR